MARALIVLSAFVCFVAGLLPALVSSQEYGTLLKVSIGFEASVVVLYAALGRTGARRFRITMAVLAFSALVVLLDSTSRLLLEQSIFP